MKQLHYVMPKIAKLIFHCSYIQAIVVYFELWHRVPVEKRQHLRLLVRSRRKVSKRNLHR